MNSEASFLFAILLSESLSSNQENLINELNIWKCCCLFSLLLTCRKNESNNLQSAGLVGDGATEQNIYEHISLTPNESLPRTILPLAQPASEHPDGDGEYCTYGQFSVASGELVGAGLGMPSGAVIAARP